MNRMTGISSLRLIGTSRGDVLCVGKERERVAVAGASVFFRIGGGKPGALVSFTHSDSVGWIVGISSASATSPMRWPIELGHRAGNLTVTIRCSATTPVSWDVTPSTAEVIIPPTAKVVRH